MPVSACLAGELILVIANLAHAVTRALTVLRLTASNKAIVSRQHAFLCCLEPAGLPQGFTSAGAYMRSGCGVLLSIVACWAGLSDDLVQHQRPWC